MNRIPVNPVRIKIAPASNKKLNPIPVESQNSLLNVPSERFRTRQQFESHMDLSDTISSRKVDNIPLEIHNKANVHEEIEQTRHHKQSFEEEEEKNNTSQKSVSGEGNNGQVTIPLEDDNIENVDFKGRFPEDGGLSPHEERRPILNHGGGETVGIQTNPDNTSTAIVANQPAISSQGMRNSPRASPSNAIISISPVNNTVTRTQSNPRAAQQNMNTRMNELSNRIEASIYRKVLENIRIHIGLAAAVLIFYLLGILVFRKIVPYHVAFAVLWFACLVRSIQALRRKPLPRMTEKQKRVKYFEAAELLIFAVFLVISTLKLEKVKVFLIPFAAIGFTSTLIFPLYYDLYRPIYKKYTVVGAKTILWGQMLLISFRADDLFTNWTYVFYLILAATFFCVAVSVGYLIVSLCYFLKHHGSADFRSFMLGHVWELFYSISSWPAAFSSFGLIQSVTNDPTSILMISLLCGIGHAVAFILYTVLAKRSIERFLMAPLLVDARAKLDKIKNNQQFDSREENAAYLVKISPTYYVEMPNGFKLKDKQQIEEMKSQIKGKKMYGRPNPIDTKIAKDNNKDKEEIREVHSAEKINRDKRKHRELAEELKRKPKDILVSRELIRPIALDTTKNDGKISYSLNDLGTMDQSERTAEQKEEDGEKQCIVCFSETPNAVIMSCGHSGVCYTCAIEAWKKDDTCLLCRNTIEKVLKVNMYSGVDVAKVVLSTKKRPFVL